jgi:concanavalin A-like lectin/glucanase superfamily protein
VSDRRVRAAAVLALVGLTAASCTRGGRLSDDGRAGAAAADSVTVALWRMDETAGTVVADAGPLRLHGEAGRAALPDFGRFGGARRFQRTLESFVYVPFNAGLETGGSFTIEAWVRPAAFGHYEDTPLAARWTEEANHQSWFFALTGNRLVPPAARLASPGFHMGLIPASLPGHVVFAFQPAEASAARAFVSARPVELDRWTHVAATYDGLIVRFYIDGLLDTQYASRGNIRPTPTPLLIGNYFDPRRLSGFGGDLRLEPGGDPNPYYAFEGLIDELRISNTARAEFPNARR